LRKALAKEQEDHALTKKAHIALNDKYYVLDEKHKQLVLQYSTLWESISHLSSAKNSFNPSNSEGCKKCYNLDMNIYSTNLANMEAMRKEIVRLNSILGTRSIEDVKTASGKEDQPKRPLYKGGRHHHIKDRLGHTKGGKTNGRKVINGCDVSSS
jgi:hypothetical protein